jgi:hypothetical protein
MAKTVNDLVLDAALNYIKTNATFVCICNAQPTTRAEAYATYMLATVAVVTGDWTVADDTSGRKVTLAQQTGETVTNSGTAIYIGIVDGTNLLYVTSCTSQVLTAGNGLTVNTFKINIQDPT